MFSETCRIPLRSLLISYSELSWLYVRTWMCTIFYKVSLHAAAMGGLICFFILFGQTDPYVSGLYIAVPIFIAGIVCSSRLILGSHNRFEMYFQALYVGILAQCCLAWSVFNKGCIMLKKEKPNHRVRT